MAAGSPCVTVNFGERQPLKAAGSLEVREEQGTVPSSGQASTAVLKGQGDGWFSTPQREVRDRT